MDTFDQIRLEETKEIVKELLVAYFKGRTTCKETVRNINDLAKRRPFNVWNLFFANLISTIKKPQSADRIRAFFWEMFIFFLHENDDEHFCFGLRMIITNLSRSNPNYSIFLGVLQAMCENPDTREQLVRVPFNGGDRMIESYPEAVDSIFLLDYLNVLLLVKMFVGLYGEDRIKEAEKALISCMINEISTSFMWAFVLFGQPLFAAYRNLFPLMEGKHHPEGNQTLHQLNEFLHYLEIITTTNLQPVLDDIVHVNSDGLPDWMCAFWRDALDVNDGLLGKGNDDPKLFGLLVEFLYPKGCVLQDAIAHSLVLESDDQREIDQISTSIIRYFEGKASQKILNLVVSFDVEFVFDPYSCTVMHRNDKFSSGYVAQFLLQHRDRIYGSFFVDYAVAIEKLHQKYIQEHKLNISLILLFRQSMNQNFPRIENTANTGSPDSLEFFDVVTGKGEPYNSILLFVSEYLSFEHIVMLGNEYLLLDKLTEYNQYLLEFSDQISKRSWKFKSCFRVLMKKLLNRLLSDSVKYVDVYRSLETDSLVYKTLTPMQCKQIFRFCSDACNQDCFLLFVLDSVYGKAPIGLPSNWNDIVNFKQYLVERPLDYNEKVGVLKRWNQILQDSMLKFHFLNALSTFLEKRFTLKNIATCCFDTLMADFMSLQMDVFDMIVCESFEAFLQGKIAYDAYSFPVRSLIGCLVSNEDKFQKFTQTNFASKYYDYLLADTLNRLPKVTSTQLSMLTDVRLIAIFRIEAEQQEMRQTADSMFATLLNRDFSIELFKAVFAKSYPNVLHGSVLRLYIVLKYLSYEEFARYLNVVLALIEQCHSQDDVNVGQLAGFILVFVQLILQKCPTDERYLQLFGVLIETQFFVHVFQTSKLKVGVISEFLFDRQQDKFWASESWSFFGILFTLLNQYLKPNDRAYEYLVGYLDSTFCTGRIPFATVLLLTNVHGKLNPFECKIIRKYFGSKSVITDEMLDACVLHAERNPSLFLSLLSTRLDPIAVYPRLKQRMEKQGYINNFIISADSELCPTTPAVLADVLCNEKFIDIIFWKKLTPPGWKGLFSLLTSSSVPRIGESYVGYLENHLQNFDWLLEHVFAGYEPSEQVVLDCLIKLTLASDRLFKPLVQRCTRCLLFKIAVERCGKADPNRTAEFLIDEYLAEWNNGSDRAGYGYVLGLLNSLSFFPSLLGAHALLKILDDLRRFIESPAQDPNIVNLKISLLLKCIHGVDWAPTLKEALIQLISMVERCDLFYLKRLFVPLMRRFGQILHNSGQ